MYTIYFWHKYTCGFILFDYLENKTESINLRIIEDLIWSSMDSDKCLLDMFMISTCRVIL